MFYKLGAQMSPRFDGKEDDLMDFEWNICMIANKYSEPEQHLFIGIRTIHDPIVGLARKLVDELNKENK